MQACWYGRISEAELFNSSMITRVQLKLRNFEFKLLNTSAGRRAKQEIKLAQVEGRLEAQLERKVGMPYEERCNVSLCYGWNTVN